MSSQMVRAVLDERKFVTRRVIKPQPTVKIVGGQEMVTHEKVTGDFGSHVFGECLIKLVGCPFGKVGDKLWVRETFAKPYAGQTGYIFRADGPEFLDLAEQKHQWGEEATWKPSIFMPKEACRLVLIICTVRVERLQDIDNKEALHEGTDSGAVDQITAYAKLWDSLNKNREYGWDTNPWVWVIGFRRLLGGKLE